VRSRSNGPSPVPDGRDSGLSIGELGELFSIAETAEVWPHGVRKVVSGSASTTAGDGSAAQAGAVAMMNARMARQAFMFGLRV
jgi:hypothetical protein